MQEQTNKRYSIVPGYSKLVVDKGVWVMGVWILQAAEKKRKKEEELH